MVQSTLTHEDIYLLRLMADGLSLEGIARRMGLSDRTVRRRTRAICERLGVKMPIQAVVWAAKQGLL